MKGIHMSEPASVASEIGLVAALEAEVDEAIALCSGDVRAALRATLIANAYLEGQVDRLTVAVSAGFARRRAGQRPKAAEAGEKKTG
jgi:hypothetical protein